MQNLLLILSLLALCFAANERSRRFSTNDDSYVPKYWRMIPRSKQVPLHELKAPNGVVPDDYFRFIPTYVGSVTVGKPLSWSTSCFGSNSATLTIDGNKSASLVVSTSDKNHFFCDDTYLLAYVGSLDITYFEIPWWNHNINWDGGWNDAQMFDIQTHGIRVFKFPDDLTASATEIFETAMMFFGAFIGTHVPEWTAEDNLKFMKDHMGVDMPVRTTTNVNLPHSAFKSGDFLGIIRLDGIDPMLCWGMGSRTGHTAMTIWMDGQLYVTESTGKTNYWPNAKGVQKTPFDEWIKIADAADFCVVHVPLSPAVAAQFNATAAAEFFKTVENLPYGFHNLLMGWVDTPEDNYPAPLSSQLVQLLAPFGEWLLQKELGLGETFDFVTQTLNHRLGTKGLTLEQTYMESYKRGINFTTLVTMPEQDDWIFENGDGLKSGPSMVCDVFVTRMWKAGGLFGPLTNQFQATEFTDWDAYTLNLFDSNYKRPQQCIDADPQGQFCQLLGKYRLDIPDYNSFAPFPNMRERCPTIPPDYKKPLKC